ncbi:MAG: S41 family peptidase [Candidatus Sulfopaludibacter sp.]|nr:S41 family peptidase [Candidatus Sulfopaludibacter sp.]
MKRASKKAKAGYVFGHAPRRCKRQPGPGTFPPNTVRLCAIVFAASISFLLPPLARAQNHPTTLPLDGLWVTTGYGELVEIKGNDLRVYEITTLSCIPSEKASRKTEAGTADEIVFAADGDTFRIVPGPSKDTLWFHVDGTISNLLLRRTSSQPKRCGQPLADTPLTNYEVFWQTFAEQYAFFPLRNVDWRAIDKKVRPQVIPDTKPEELFRILSGMVEPLHDKHIYIDAPSIHKGFRGSRPPTDTLQDGDKPRVTEIIETKYVPGKLRDFCNGQLQLGRLRPPQGAMTTDSERKRQADLIEYLRIHSFARYSKDDDFEKQLAVLQAALDEIFEDAFHWSGLVIDIRINSGGFDQFGVAIASRLATLDYFAWEKVARDDIRDPDHHTPPQPIMVHASQRPGFRGPVVLLTSAHALSAAETFTMALLGRDPHITRIGANTQGVFSDELDRVLPNGWRFGLSNETYLTKDGKSFEGTGVPPDIEVPIFPKEDLAEGRDSALDKVLEVLAHKAR